MARGKHKTVPRELKKNINWLENKLGVKIVLGISECARHKYPPGHIRLVEKTGAGFRAFFIVCRDEEILELIVAKFEVSF